MNNTNVVLDRFEPTEDIAQQLDLVQSRLDRLLSAVEQIDRRREELEDLVTDLMPAINGAIGVIGRRLAELEQSGVTAFARETVQSLEQVARTVDPRAIRALAERAGNLVETAHALSSPEVTAVATQAAAALVNARRGRPPAWFTLVRARKEPRIRRGLGALLEILRALGDSGSGIGDRGSGIADHGSRITDQGSRITDRGSGSGDHCPVAPAAGGIQLRQIAGQTVQTDAEGFLVDRRQWTREIAQAIAATAGIAPLTAEHWAVIEFCQHDANETGASPGLRRITQQLGITAKQLYALFPRGPGILAARVGGLPKPKSCV